MKKPYAESGALSGEVDWAGLRPPSIVPVVHGSTPVPFFGDPGLARVATIGLNPSSIEFLDGRGRLLSGRLRRLATTDSLGSAEPGQLSELQVGRLLQDCQEYFSRNPYRRWFDQLDVLLRRAFNVSYYDGTAVHLDLSVWATDPPWGRLSAGAQSALLADGVPILSQQLKQFGFETILLNGSGVTDRLTAAGLVDLHPVGAVASGAVTAKIGISEADGTRWISWSTNLQSSFGVSNSLRTQLADKIKASRQPTPSRRAIRPKCNNPTLRPAMSS